MRFLIFFLLIYSCTFNEPMRGPSSISEHNKKNILPNQEMVLMIEFKQIPMDIEKKIISGLVPQSRLEIFDDYDSDYFKRLYRLSFLADINFQEDMLLKLNSIKFLKRVERVYPAIHVPPALAAPLSLSDRRGEEGPEKRAKHVSPGVMG